MSSLNPADIQAHAQNVQASMGGSPYDTSNATPLGPNMSVGQPAPIQPDPAPQQVAAEQTAGAGAAGLINPNARPGVTNPHNPNYVPVPSLSPDVMLTLNAHDREAYNQKAQQAGHATIDAANSRNEADQFKSDAEEPIYDAQRQLAGESAERMQAATVMRDQDVDKVMKAKQQTIQEQSDYANSMPTDLWGASGVNKIAGIIGLAMGTLGGAATGGKNSALEAMNALADRNLRQMKQHYDMLGDKVKGYDTTYSQIRQKFGDTQTSEIATRMVMNDYFTNALKQAGSSTMDKTAKANLQQTIAGVENQQLQNQAEMMKITGTQVDHAATIGQQQYATQTAHAEEMMRQANSQGAGGAGLPGEINGMDAPQNAGLRLSKAATDKAREEQQGVSEVHETVEDIKAKLKAGGLNSALEKSQAEAALKLAIVKAHNLSRRVGGDEGKLIEQDAGRLSLGLPGWALNKIDNATVMNLMNSLDQSTERAYVKGLVTNGYSITKGGMYDHSNEPGSDRRDGNPIGGIQTREQQAATRQMAPIPTYTGAG